MEIEVQSRRGGMHGFGAQVKARRWRGIEELVASPPGQRSSPRAMSASAGKRAGLSTGGLASISAIGGKVSNRRRPGPCLDMDAGQGP